VEDRRHDSGNGAREGRYRRRRGTSFGSLVDFDGTLFFGTNTDLWKSDGTAAGTVVVSSAERAR
jgi:hypothetical protein